jgi:hypothetical protein
MRFVTFLLAGLAPAAFGGLMTLPGQNDTVDFNTLSVNTNLTGSFNELSANGVTVTISEPSSSFVVDKQGSGWAGNFPNNTVIIYDQGPSGYVTFSFSTPIKGLGLNVDDAVGGNYQGTIQAFNGITPVSSLTTVLEPYGLIFLSDVDPTADITSVEVGTFAVENDTFAFSNLSMIDSAVSTAPSVAPEPASIGIVLLGLAILCAVARFRDCSSLEDGGARTDSAGMAR